MRSWSAHHQASTLSGSFTVKDELPWTTHFRWPQLPAFNLSLNVTELCRRRGSWESHLHQPISLLQVCWTCSMNTLSLISQCRFVITLRQLLRKRLSEVQWQLYFGKCLQNLSEPHTSSYLLPSSCISSPLAAHCCSAQLNLHLTLHPTVYLKLYRLGMIKLVTSQPQLLIYFSKSACSCTPLWSTEQVIFQNRRGKNALALRHHSLAQSVSSPVLSAAVAWFIPAPPVLDQLFPAFPAPDPAAALRLWRVHGLQLLELLLHAALHCRHLPLPETTSGESPECLDQTGLEPGALGDSRGWTLPRVRHRCTAVLCLQHLAARPGTALGAPGLFKRNRQWQALGTATPDLTVLLSCWTKRLLDTFQMPQDPATFGRVARGSGCVWCQYVHVLVSGIPVRGLLSTKNVYSSLLSELNLFSSFLMEKYDNQWIQNALCSILC